MQKEEKSFVLDGFLVKKQQTLSTCGYATLSMVLSFLGRPIEEKKLFKFFPSICGTPSEIFIKLFNYHAKNFFINQEQVKDKDELIRLLDQQLSAGYPVPIIYFTVFPKNKKLLHYAVVIGIKENKVLIADPSPFAPDKITMTIDNFWGAIGLNDSVKVNGWGPFRDKIGLGLGVVKRNTIFIIRQKNYCNLSNSKDIE